MVEGMERADLPGLWTRSLLAWPDGRRDVTTVVEWLQGPTLFADLRSPADRPSFEGVGRLRDLSFGQIEWLARQEGFAGALSQAGGFFEWNRVVDYQPPTGRADAGSLRMEGDVVVERGRDEAYLEHWRRDPLHAPAPAAALALRDGADGRAGYLVRAGDVFIYVRDRAAPLSPGSPLADCIAAAPDLRQAQDMVDCEISRGQILADGAWRIDRSSLPYREGCDLGVAVDAARGLATTSDQDADGRPFVRRWSIEQAEGAWPMS